MAVRDDARWRVFLSYTAELQEFPRGGSYAAAAERAVSASGHVVVDLADFPALDLPPSQLVADRVRSSDVYVGILGTRYGFPVPDQPEVSYTELEFNTATTAGLPRLVFMLDDESERTGIPPSRLVDPEFGPRQEAFRRRVRESVTVQSFTDPEVLGLLVARSLRDLALTRRPSASRVFIANTSNAELVDLLKRSLEGEGVAILNPRDGPPRFSPDAFEDAISSADVVVADITGGDPNSFFELGMAHALGIPLVLLMGRNNLVGLPSSLAGNSVIFYDESDPSAIIDEVKGAIKRLGGRP